MLQQCGVMSTVLVAGIEIYWSQFNKHLMYCICKIKDPKTLHMFVK